MFLKSLEFSADMTFKDDFCVIPVSKDPSLITALTSFIDEAPQAILTTNGVRLLHQAVSNRQVAFNHLVDGHPNLVLSDGNLQALLVGAETPFLDNTDIPRNRWDIYVAKFREEVMERLDRLSQGRPIALNTYANSPNAELLKKMGFLVLGPDSGLVEKYSNKIEAYRLAKKLNIPTLPGEVTYTLEETLETVNDRLKEWERGAFLTAERGAGGRTSFHITDIEDIVNLKEIPPFLITRWVEKKCSPNSQVLIGVDEMIYLGLTDQIIENEVEYFGNLFPSQTSERIQEKIREYSLKIANHMRQTGYRGFVGFDWVVPHKEEVYFGEINARKNRSSSMLVSALEKTRPAGTLSISELEALATLNQPWVGIKEWKPESNTTWGMRLFKTWGNARVTRSIRPIYDDSTIFYATPGSSAVLNFPERGTYLERFPTKHDLARIITTGHTREEVESTIKERRKEVMASYSKL